MDESSETTDDDREVLRAVAFTIGVDPDSDLCPDIDRIVQRDIPLGEKVSLLENGIKENFNQRRRGAV